MANLRLRSRKGNYMPNENKMTYDQAMIRLNEIVAELEKNEVPLEDAIKLFEEGLNLVNECEKKLNTFDQRLQQVMKDHNLSDQNHEQ